MTIRTKLIIAVTAVMSLVLAGLATFVYIQVVNTQLSKLDAHLSNHAEKLAAELEENYAEHNFPDIPALLEIRTEGITSPAIRVLDSTGHVLYADSLVRTFAVHGWSEVVSHHSILETIQHAEQPFRSYWTPVEIDDQLRYLLQVIVPLEELYSSASLLRLRLLLVVPLFILLSALIIYGIVRTSFKPITTMIETAEHTSGSDLTGRVPLKDTRDEVHTLGIALNRMMERIDHAFQAQKQFVADASHEIRTPLTIIQSETEFAHGRIRDRAARKSLRTVVSEVDHLKTLAEDLLLIARLDSPSAHLKRERVDVSHLVHECVQKMKIFAGRQSVSLRYEKSPHIILQANRDQIERVILNLLDNAVRHSGPRTKVRASVNRENRFAIIRIDDNGAGIAPDELPHIFDRFHRGPLARAGRTGSGLGLAIVQKIVEVHGGTIDVTSAPHKGSVFTVKLPLGIEPPA